MEISLEEIQGKLEAFPESFKHRFGQPLDPQKLVDYLNTQLAKKELQLIEDAFSHYSPQSIRMILSELVDKPVGISESWEPKDTEIIHGPKAEVKKVDKKKKTITIGMVEK